MRLLWAGKPARRAANWIPFWGDSGPWVQLFLMTATTLYMLLAPTVGAMKLPPSCTAPATNSLRYTARATSLVSMTSIVGTHVPSSS